MNEQNTFEAQSIAWTPTADVIEKSQLTRFMKQTGAETFDEVYQQSIESIIIARSLVHQEGTDVAKERGCDYRKEAKPSS